MNSSCLLLLLLLSLFFATKMGGGREEEKKKVKGPSVRPFDGKRREKEILDNVVSYLNELFPSFFIIIPSLFLLPMTTFDEA